MTEIRPSTPQDMPAVAALFQRTFRDPRRPAPASLQSYLRELFFEHPWFDPELAPKVYVAADGKVGGFIGSLPLRLVFAGRPVRAAIAGSLMVDGPQANPLAGARLLRAFFTGPQELSVSDSANPVSHGMWERLGGKSAPTESMEWLRAFRPAATATALAAEAVPLMRLARPLAAVADGIASRLNANPMRLERAASPADDVEASEDELIRLIPELSATYSVRPAWDQATLRWLLRHAATKRQHGNAFRRVVRDKGGAPLGCYLYYGRARAIGRVLQILARQDGVAPVIDALFAHAHAQGCIAVRGRSHARFLDLLQRRGAIFFHRSATVMHSHNVELASTIATGDALVTGLSGDAWTRLVGDTFI